MKVRCETLVCALAGAVVGMGAAPAAGQVFGPGDPILAVDSDLGVDSSYPDAEGPFYALDQDSSTKYLNFGREGTGLIFTPEYGASVVRSIRFTTANDAPGRDPASFELYGTNDPIVSEDNSAGDAENWTLIAADSLSLPDERFTNGPVNNFANGASYTSYKVVFPTVKDACENSMQIADLSLFTGTDGGGDQVAGFFDDFRAVGTLGSESKYPCSESPANAIDGDAFNKYLNFGKQNSGFIVARADGQAVVVESFAITTANDYPERDPNEWALYGTNDPITSEDNSTGEAENWTLVDSGTVDLPDERFTLGPTVSVNNATAYKAYKLLFPSLKDNSGDFPADSMQIAEVFIDGQGGDCYADFNGDGAVDTRDVIAFLNAWNAQDAASDCDNNGAIDTRDVICFLNGWNAGC